MTNNDDNHFFVATIITIGAEMSSKRYTTMIIFRSEDSSFQYNNLSSADHGSKWAQNNHVYFMLDIRVI